MATVYFASARIDENGNARGGKAGDQNKREIMRQPFYVHEKGWIVLRPKNTAMAEKIAWNMEAACDNDLIGYDQGQRDTLFNLAKLVNYDCSMVKSKVETDCSALVRVAIAFAGKVVASFRTDTEVSALMATGLFDKLTDKKFIKKSDYLRRGDVLCTATKGHTGVIVNDGKYADETVTPVPSMQAPATPEEKYLTNWVTAIAPVNVRKGPGTKYGIKMKLATGEALMYDGAVSGEWYAVDVQGKRYWVSSRYTKPVVREKPIIDISRWNNVKDWTALAEKVSFIWIKVGSRLLSSGGPLKLDAKFRANAAAANAAGIPFGVYFYGRAKTIAQGDDEAFNAVGWAEPYKPACYAYDVEVSTNTQEAVQAFIDTVKTISKRPCGTYIGRRWTQVNGDKLERDYQWSPYYNTGTKGPSWLLFHGRNPSHPHDCHQYSPSLILRDAISGVDVSHVNDDPKTQYKGHGVLWLRTGGKEGK